MLWALTLTKGIRVHTPQNMPMVSDRLVDPVSPSLGSPLQTVVVRFVGETPVSQTD